MLDTHDLIPFLQPHFEIQADGLCFMGEPLIKLPQIPCNFGSWAESWKVWIAFQHSGKPVR